MLNASGVITVEFRIKSQKPVAPERDEKFVAHGIGSWFHRPAGADVVAALCRSLPICEV